MIHNTLTEQEIKQQLQQIKRDLEAFPGTSALESECDACAKHIPAYLKIVKGHIAQLAQVLKMDSHHNRTLDNIPLAEPVKQLIQIFNALGEEDIPLFESLALSARQWEEQFAVSKMLDYANATEA